MRDRLNDLVPSYMFLTAEVRWFRSGDSPREAKDLFLQSKLKDVAGVRTDTYLLFPNAETAGVKFRENRFEVKTLVRACGSESWKNNTGITEIWEKWSAEGGSIDNLFKDVRSDGSVWIDVHKRRVLRKFSTAGGKVVEVDASAGDVLLDDGCNVELTEVETLGDRFWTIGFESFSMERDLLDNLVQTVRHFFERDGAAIGFTEEESCSYPAFLRQFYRR